MSLVVRIQQAIPTIKAAVTTIETFDIASFVFSLVVAGRISAMTIIEIEFSQELSVDKEAAKTAAMKMPISGTEKLPILKDL